ncbi:MAG: SDR family NAD(P)-dependent oxidoreductase [Acidobacteriota bacterium]
MNRSILAVTPLARCDAAIAIAAMRAGEVGILDLGPAGLDTTGQAELARLASFAGGRRNWGIRWHGDRFDPERLDLATRRSGASQVPVLMLAGAPPSPAPGAAALSDRVARARQVAEQVLVEGTEGAVLEAAVAAGADGLILRTEEAGGRVGKVSAFVLLQALPDDPGLPIWVAGAFGPETAAAARLAGAAGVVLGEELWLAREAPWSPDERRRLAAFDGTESQVSERGDGRHRLFAPATSTPDVAARPTRDAAGRRPIDWCAMRDPTPLSQGVAFASDLAQKHVTVAGILAAFREQGAAALSGARKHAALAENSPLARASGTRYPIFQGPMTRVSDGAEFCAAVAGSGGLPFLALALMRRDAVSDLLRATRERLQDRPFGVGILGFVPRQLRREQLEAVRRHPPRFALIAGGRPSQAVELEAEGIATYLHVPSPRLLEIFLDQGARRFIFEGRECGGHVGPRSSLVLWQQAVDVLRATSVAPPGSIHAVFAGGIHDAASAAMVAVLAEPLVARGIGVGVLMGTAYLFTREAVSSGAITRTYQETALACRRTALLASGVGHATRCATTPFADEFQRRREALLQEGRSADEIRFDLEMLNVGRLRLASKGLVREETGAGAIRRAAGRRVAAAPGAGPTPGRESAAKKTLLARGEELLSGRLTPVDVARQQREGMYMIGEVATLRDEVVSMADLHADVAAGSVAEIERRTAPATAPRSGAAIEAADTPRPAPDAIAIIGMACRFPGSPDLRAYWHNILAGFDAVREVPSTRWPADRYFSTDRTDRDRLYSRWGAFLDERRFDPLRYGIPPASVPHIEPTQLLTLDVCCEALADAGYANRPFHRERTAAIFASGGVSDLGIAYALRTVLPEHLDGVAGLSDEVKNRIVDRVRARLPEWSEDSFPGFLLNVLSGRVANRLDLQGPNFVVDAACAASLAAVQTASEQLQAGRCDMALVGAADGTNNAFTFMSFARTHALSPGGKLRAFDADADGIVLGEGIGVIVVKRLADAERDGDRIHAVLRGIGSSSDGRNRSLTAPHSEAQALAIERAYANAGVAPRTVGLVEAHATGTAAGDRSEIAAMKQVFGVAAGEPSCAIGSVKSMIGHTKTVAGLAGLIKTTLALSQRVLPPTINVTRPNPAVTEPGSPFYINTETRPWVNHEADTPRRAGVSAFGFGGTNFHLVLEEYGADPIPSRREDLSPRAAELFLWGRPERDSMLRALAALSTDLSRLSDDVPLSWIAAHHARDETRATAGRRPAAAPVRCALVATSVAGLREKLGQLQQVVRTGEGVEDSPAMSGLFVSDGPAIAPAAVCFLYPGQGAQRPGMLQDLVQFGPFGTRGIETADRLLADLLPASLAGTIYPPPALDAATRKARQRALDDTRMAQPALGVMNLLATDVLRHFGLTPAFTAGHSYGEYVALCVAGLTDREHLLRLSALRGQAVHEAGRVTPGGMAAVAAGEARTREVIEERGLSIELANLNAPRQTIVAGSLPAIDEAMAAFSGQGVAIRRIAVTAPFHTSAMEAPSRAIWKHLRDIPMQPPRIPVFSNVTAAPYPADVQAVRSQLAVHLARPVRFVEEIEALHAAGARLFIEAGPGRILTGLVGRILAGQDHHAMALEAPGRPGWEGLAGLLARAHTLGLPVNAMAWFTGRLPDESALDRPGEPDHAARPTDWLLRPGGARPASAPPEADTSIMRRSAPAGTEGEFKMTDPAGTPDARTAGAPRQTLERLQDAMEQWLDLQRTQQRLSERFLAVQERLVAGLMGQPAPAPAEADHSTATCADGTIPAVAATREPAALGVAPAPVLPDLVPTDPPAAAAPATGGDDSTATGDVESHTVAAPERDIAASTSTPATSGTAPPPLAQFQDDLIREVSTRTGYPADMLKLDVPLEAGLGIDSIKTMEIFSALNAYHAVLASDGQDDEEILVQFTQMKTLGDILAHYRQRLEVLSGVAPSSAAQSASPEVSGIADAASGVNVAGVAMGGANGSGQATVLAGSSPVSDNGHDVVRRLVPRSVRAPAAADPGFAGESIPFPAGDILLVLGEAPELGSSLQAALSASGISAYQVVPGRRTRQIHGNRFEANLSSSSDLRRLAARIRAAGGGRVGGLVNLLTLSESMSKPGCRGAQAPLRLVRWLTRVAQVFEEDIRASSQDGGGWLLNVTTLDGRFGLCDGGDLPVAQAGSLGFFKSLAREWPGVRVKNIDLDPEADPRTLMVGMLQELAGGDDAVEVGVDGEGRWHLELAASPLPAPATNGSDAAGNGLDLGDDAVILATGGARGITSEVIRELSRRTPARLILVGQSPRPGDEPPAWENAGDRSALRDIVLAQMQAGDPAVTPARVEKRLDDILRDRAIRDNLRAFEAAGAEVEYHAVDVRNARVFGAFIDDVYRRHGRIDGVIHGAGRIEDRWLRDKTLESLGRVFETKVNGALVLARKLRPASLRFLVFFASVSGRFGNAGQTDYSAANECLNKLARHLDHRWPGRVVSVNWGPWDAGMISEGLRVAYRERGIGLIPVSSGVRSLIDELTRPEASQAEVILACTPERLAAPAGQAP